VGAQETKTQEPAMMKKAAIAGIALLMTTSSLAFAAETSSTVGMRQPSAADLNSLTDMRVGLVKAALQMTPEQEKLWPLVEEAIRARAKNRMARLEKLAELHNNAMTDAATSDRNPLEIMQRRADLLIQRGTDLKKVTDAWEPLYKTLTQDQKRRMAFVSMVALRGMRDAIEHRGENEDDDD
jgi:LTXXQ motif family protein